MVAWSSLSLTHTNTHLHVHTSHTLVHSCMHMPPIDTNTHTHTYTYTHTHMHAHTHTITYAHTHTHTHTAVTHQPHTDHVSSVLCRDEWLIGENDGLRGVEQYRDGAPVQLGRGHVNNRTLSDTCHMSMLHTDTQHRHLFHQNIRTIPFFHNLEQMQMKNIHL